MHVGRIRIATDSYSFVESDQYIRQNGLRNFKMGSIIQNVAQKFQNWLRKSKIGAEIQKWFKKFHN